MRAIRFILSVVVLTGWSSFRIITLALFGVRHRPGQSSPYDGIQRAWGRRLLAINRIKVALVPPAEPITGPVVYISNHASFVDIWALVAALPGSLRFLFKKEFMYFPVMGLAMRAMGHISIDRARRTKAFESYELAADGIRKGVSAVVFAEGTRSRSGKLLPFKKGPFVLAISAQVPIVPIFCAGTFDRLPKGHFSPSPGLVEVRVGAPIETTGLTYDARDELSQRARKAVLELGAVE